jgi:pimeloyl-ACP methyl ester carboxylesterase
MTTWLNASIQMRFRVIDGLSVRYAESDDRSDTALLSPWPESLFAFEPTWPRLAEHAHLVAVDLPGFGHSQRRDALLSPQAMGDFIGSGGTAVPLQLGSLLKDWVEVPDLDRFREADPRQIVAGALSGIERYALPDPVREDYLSSYEGDRFVESMRYVRTYPDELPALRDLLPQVLTPVQIIAGGRDKAVPPVNAEFLHERLPHSKLDIVDAGHFTWEDGADQYAALVTTWWSGGYSTA